MAARIRAHRWADTPLGPIETWPRSLRTIVDLMLASPSMMSLVWGAEAIHIHNDSFAELLREHHAQTLGKSAFETFARSRDSFEADVAAGMAGTSARLLAQRYPVLRNGRWEDAWFDAEYVPVRDETGGVAGVLWTLKEVTAQVLAERSVRESEARLRPLVGSWAQAIWETDPAGLVVHDSPSWRAYTGQTLDEWLGYGWLDAIHPDDRAYAERQWREAIGARGLVDAEYRLRAPDGGWRWTNVRAAPVLDAGGNVEKWAGMNIDIDDRKRAEADLRANEDRYRLLFDAIDDGFCTFEMIFDETGEPVDFRYMEVNAGFERQTGQRPRPGQTMREIFPQAEHMWLDLYAEVTRTGEAQRFVDYVGGLDRWYDVYVFPVDRNGSRVLGALFRDVTDQKRAEEALKASEERFRSLFETMGQGYSLSEIVRDAAGRAIDFRYIEHNPALERLTGVPASEASGRLASEVFPGLDPFWVDALDRVVTSGRAESVEHELTSIGRWYQATFYPVGGDRCVSLYDDITERKRAETALRESEARLRNVLKIQTVGVMFWGEGFGLTDVNDAFLRLTGLTREETLGKTWADLTPPEFHDASLKAIHEVLTRGESTPYEKQHYRKDGSRWWGLFAARRIGDEVVEFVLDVTERREAGAALRDSEERFRSMAEAIEDVFYITDLDRNALVYLSPGYERIWGRPRDELETDLGAFLHTIHPDDRARVMEGKAAQERGEPVVIEYRIVRPDGAVRWVLDRSFPVPGTSGRRSAGVASDITQRREAEDRVRASEALLRQFGEASSDVLWVRNAPTLQFEYVSPAFEAIYGVGIREIETGNDLSNWANLVLDDDRGQALANIERVRAGEQLTFEYRIRRPADGTVRWLRDTDFPMRDASGRIERFGGVGQDVTELKRIEAALRESEGRLRTLMGGIPQLVWRSGDEGQWTWSSPQWQAFTGQSFEASLGLGWLDAVHPDDRGETVQAWKAATPHGMLDVEYRVRRAADGEYLWHHSRSLPVRDEQGRISEWLGTTTDVQQLKELQERQAVMVAELQHRTRNLIAVVRSIAQQTMAQTGPTDAFRHEFEHRLEALSRVQGLLSRSDEEPITIEALIRMELEALGAFREAGERIALSGPSAPIRHSMVQTLALALHELATNARKYGALASHEGRLRVTWRIADANGQGRRLHLEWTESGAVPTPQPVPARRGYGRELIEQALPYALGATTTYELGGEGVRCTIDLPLERAERRRRPR